MKLILVILAVTFPASFLQAEERSFKFSFGSSLGSFPFEINKTSKNLKKPQGIKINSWTLTPNFSSLTGNKKKMNFSKNKNSKEKIYIKFNLKF